MSQNIQKQVLRMLEAITINIALPRYIESISIQQPDFYFEICQIIFPKLQMKIIKIQESEFLNVEEKMQHLIDLLSKQLEYDLTFINGEGILNGDFLQIHQFLRLLQQCSEGLSDRREGKRVRSENRVQNENNYGHKYIQSARDRNITQQSYLANEKKRESQGNRYRPKSMNHKRKNRNLREKKKNVYNSILNIVWNEKNRATKASFRDNRAQKNKGLIEEKNKYKSFLLNQSKQHQAHQKRTQQLSKKNNASKFMLRLSDFQDIGNFFESFSLKFRDQKQSFLRRMKQHIRTQEIDQMEYRNKLEREQRQCMEEKTTNQLHRLNIEFNIRSCILQEKSNQDKKSFKTMKKAYKTFLNEQKYQLKKTKKNQLNILKNSITGENNKLLMQFEQGGELQKIINDMYKRFKI